MTCKPAVRRVAILVLDDTITFELATAWDVLRAVRDFGLAGGYDVRMCGSARDLDLGGFSLHERHGLGALAQAHTIVVPGVSNIEHAFPASAMRALRAAADRGARVVSSCSGAFVLAQAGLRHARVRRAQHLLETTALSIESIAAAVGFGSASTLRRSFQHMVVTSPREYRRAFRPTRRSAASTGARPM